MSEVKIMSDKTKQVSYTTRTRKLSVGEFTVTEHFQDDELLSQDWKPSKNRGWKRFFPDAYSPKSLYFQYFEDLSFLNSDECVNYTYFYETIPEATLVTDWDNFKGLDHVLCIYLDMDGNIYRLSDLSAVPLWRRQDYIGGVRNDIYDLGKAAKALKKVKWIRNVDIIDIPYYNATGGCTKAVEFDYKLPTRKDLWPLLSDLLERK